MSIRRRINTKLMGQASAAPGNDPRTWIAIARVDDDPDAIRFREEEDGPVGWVVDVTFQGGPLDQEGPIPCRYGSSFTTSGGLRSEPIGRNCLVVVAIPGNPNDECSIVGQLPTEGCEPPSEVNGTEFTEEYALSNHVLVTPHGVDEQIEGDRRIKTGGTHRLLGPSIELADEGAGASYVRGEDMESAINAFGDAVATYSQTVLTAAANLAPQPPLTPVTGAMGALFVTGLTQGLAQLQAAVAQLKAAANTYKSTRIKGE